MGAGGFGDSTRKEGEGDETSRSGLPLDTCPEFDRERGLPFALEELRGELDPLVEDALHRRLDRLGSGGPGVLRVSGFSRASLPETGPAGPRRVRCWRVASSGLR